MSALPNCVTSLNGFVTIIKPRDFLTFRDSYLRHIALCYQTARTLGLFFSHVGTQIINICHAPAISKFGDRRNQLTTIRHDVIIREPIVVAA